jgi:hypothetical protein
MCRVVARIAQALATGRPAKAPSAEANRTGVRSLATNKTGLGTITAAGAHIYYQ